MENTQTTVAKTTLISFTIMLPVAAFLIPLVISGPQILTGSLVNAFLFLATMQKISTRSRIVIAILPSAGAVINGVLFGTFTPFLLYLMPAIWLGNMLIMHIYDMVSRRFEPVSAILVGAGFKSFTIFAWSLFLFRLHIIPQTLINAMGIVQFTTAVMGGFGAFAIMSYLRARND